MEEMNAKGLILTAFDQFRLKSCIDFKPRDSEKYYISVQKLSGCFSFIGRVIANGQDLSIGKNCDSISTVEHEFLHALGFYHEHTRYDRDGYVTIFPENIRTGSQKTFIITRLFFICVIPRCLEKNFVKGNNKTTTTQGFRYDYMSVMHYSGNAFSNGNGSTIVTIDPKYQDVIGQRLEMSHIDVLELNSLYKCNSTIAFKMHCSFSNGSMCQMTRCSQSGRGWEMETTVQGGPESDHTSLPNGSGEHGKSYFMHASTASGKEGDSAWLETHMMSTNREHHIQCLQFYYYHSGNPLDHLNIWIREFQNEQDLKGNLRLMGQITGAPTSFWQLHHVTLNATKHFQVEFEVRKGAGNSSGGFSIDDINLSELECPHVTLQLDEFKDRLSKSSFGTTIYSPRQYSTGGYAYAVAVIMYKTYFGAFVQLLSGKSDDQLQWPCLQRQVTFKMLDQNSNIQLQMSKLRTITTDLSKNSNDLTPLVNGSVLPCPQKGPVEIKHPPRDLKESPCSSR
ncbi:meprin A subunit beta-like [Cottoperca gobio]|uniref:Metalloendopeptidase n=1 Tax=Cottoperca gobio TaxID=56716 RepID=A0A6J2RA18_COTGO|nr:meprin A subunit beta-like [Cottoperca gobio]